MSFWKRVQSSIYPVHPAPRAAFAAAALLILFAAILGAIDLNSGFGFGVDLLFTLLLALIGVPLASALLALLFRLLRLAPPLPTSFFVAATAFLALTWMALPGILFASLVMLIECSMAAAIVSAFTGSSKGTSRLKRILTWTLLALSLSANIVLLAFLLNPGSNDELPNLEKLKSTLPPPIAASDPSLPGPYRVKTLHYGSGDSLRRPEFSASVDIRTPTVNASPFFKDFDGWKAWIRHRYWGFGVDKLPLNATVFYPDAPGPFPLFLIVHGNHQMSVPSDLGYEYLCRLLASRGFIAASVDENFLNSGFFHDLPREQPVRGWLLLEHLRLWHQWNRDPHSPFYRKVDLDNIALAGHSRGGEAAATAALFNVLNHDPDDATIAFHYGFHIKSIIAVAPPDGQYKPAEQWRVLKDVNYLTLQGANDSDVASFTGSRQYDHVHFTGPVPAFKSELYIYRANHSRFNTTWGGRDFDQFPFAWFLNSRNLLPPDMQRQVAKLYISAFLDATLRGKTELIPMFRDYRVARRWLPQTLYTNRFKDHQEQTLCSFDEDADVTTTTVPGGRISATGLTLWREAKIPFRDGSRDYNGVFLGWNWTALPHAPNPPPAYVIDLPPGINWSALVLSVAATDDDAPLPSGKTSDDGDARDDATNFSLEAVTAKDPSPRRQALAEPRPQGSGDIGREIVFLRSTDGNRARVEIDRFAWLLPPPRAPLTKLEQLDRWLYKDATEPVFQTIRIPREAFQQSNPDFQSKDLRQIRLVFDRTPTRVIIVSEVGFVPSLSN